jgi:D-aminopeptidase
MVVPHDGDIFTEPVFAGSHTLNGNGELTGLEWIRESGLLTTPIGLTNTHSVGVVRDALVAAQQADAQNRWSLPVVGETWDGVLNDINGFHVEPEHVSSALAAATADAVGEGSVGGGSTTVTPVRTLAPSISVVWPTRTPSTSVIAFAGPGGSRPISIPRSRARGIVRR